MLVLAFILPLFWVSSIALEEFTPVAIGHLGILDPLPELQPEEDDFVPSSFVSMHGTLTNKTIEGNGTVIHVTDGELRDLLEALNDDEALLVQFFAQWCDFSREFEPVYIAVAQTFPTLAVAALDASRFSALNYKFGIYGFPKLMLFKGNKTAGYSYKKFSGNRTLEAITQFVARHIKCEPEKGIKVVIPPALHRTTETNFYLHCSVALLLVLCMSSLKTLWATRDISTGYRTPTKTHT